MKSQKPFAQAHQRLLTTLDPNAGWLLLQLQLATCYPHRHAANGASIKLSYDEMASLARISKASVRGLLERLVSGGWIKFEEGGGRAKSTIRCLLQPEHQLNCTVQPQASTNSLTLNINNLPAGSVASSNNPVVYQMVAARSAAAIPLPKPPVQASPPEPNATAALEEQKNKNQNNNDGRGRGADTPISILPEPTPTPAYIPPSSTPPTRRDQLLGWLTTYYRCPPIPELVRWAEELLSWPDEPTVTYLQAAAERGRVENGGQPVKIRWLEITVSNLKQSGVRREEHTRDRTSPKPAVPGEYATAYATAASFADPAPADPAPLPTTLPAVPAPDRAAAEPLTLPADAGTDDPTPEPTQLPASPPTVPVPTAASYVNPVLPAAPAPASDQHPRASPVPYPPVVPDQSLTPREEYRHDPASTQPRRPTPGKYAAAYATAASFAPSG